MKTEQEHNNEQCTMNNVQWKKVKLGEVIVDSYAGGTPNRSRSDYFGGDIPWVSSGEVNNPEINSTLENISIEGLNNSSAKWIPENSILVALYGATAGQVSMLRIKATSNQAVLAVIPKADVADTMFLFYQIVYNKDNLLYLAQGSGQPNLSKNLVDGLEISVPDLPAQRRIAAILASADKVIAATQKTIAKYKQIKQGMMEDLLKPKEGWKMVKLGEVCMPSSEKYNPLTEDTFQYCIEMENINQESGTINGKSDITKLLSLKTKFHKGEVLYGKLRPYLKKYWLADFDGACSTEIWVLKNSENIDNQFLFYLFQSDCINRIANQSSGTKMPRADWKFMEKQTVSIPFKNDKPDLTEQRRIAAILSGIDAKIAAEEKVLQKYEKVKKGLMEKLLNEQCTMNNEEFEI